MGGLRSTALAYAAPVFQLRARRQSFRLVGSVGKHPENKIRNAQDGRERLIESARAIFRSKVRREVSRLDIARHAGVVPGLVTYYFENNADLVLAVTRPVLSEAIGKLVEALNAPVSIEDRLEQSAVLFIDFARDNGTLLDLFVEAVTESGDESGQELIHACIDRLERFFTEMVEARLVSSETDPILLLMTMWGMCRLVGETPPLALKNVRPDAGLDERTTAEARFITKLILRGAKPISE